MKDFITFTIFTYASLALLFLVGYSEDYSIMKNLLSTCEPTQVILMWEENYYNQTDQVEYNDTISFETAGQCLDSNILISQNGILQTFIKHEIIKNHFNHTLCQNNQKCADSYVHKYKIKLPQQGPFLYQVNGRSSFLQSQIMTFNAGQPLRVKQKNTLPKIIQFDDLVQNN